jgi:hypothetical protein
MLKKLILYIGICSFMFLGAHEIQAQTNTFPSSGNVGIGTTSPGEKLTISGGNLYISNGEASMIYSSHHNLKFSGIPGGYAHRIYTFRPAWGNSGNTWTKLQLQTANTLGEHSTKILLHSGGNSYINAGKVGIGTTNPTEKLTINGTAKAKEIIVEENVGADFVFANDYALPSLPEVEKYIIENQHLPEIPSAEEMVKNGVKVGELQMRLLQKIEELTLYVIEQRKEQEMQRREFNKKLDQQKIEIEQLKQIIQGN